MKRLVLGLACALCVAAACSNDLNTTPPVTNNPYAGSWIFVQGACTWGPVTVSGSGAFGSSNASCASIEDNTLMGTISASGAVTGTQAFEGGSTFTLTGSCTTDVTCSGTLSGGAVLTWSMSK